MPGRWEQLLDQKPVPVLEALLDEVAKRLSGDLARWPLPVEDVDTASLGSFAPLLSPEVPPPGAPLFREAFRLARWELERALDAMDDYLRNRRYLERGVA